ncbi:MAG: helix-turn-helix transcriptional regulator [Butyrivibrio sp.]|nr:helix-turn-helix transcriptional regulator [Butyrivibrio sp.]
MAIKSVGEKIRELRKKAGLSQEKLCETGFCTPSELSAIENGQRVLSPVTYQCLTQYMGVYQSPYPEFLSIEDYRCYMLFFKVRFFVESWQLIEALGVLEEIEKLKFADNKYYYQEWLMYYSFIMELSGEENLNLRVSIIEEALRITIHTPIGSHVLKETDNKKLTIVELQLYICLGNIYLIQEKNDECLQIIRIIDNSGWSNKRSIHDDFLSISIKLLKYQYLLAVSENQNLETQLDFSYKEAVNTYLSVSVIRMSGTYAAALYMKGRKKEGRDLFENFKAGCKLYRAYYGDELCRIARNDADLNKEIHEFIIPRYRKKVAVPKKYDIVEMGDGSVDAYNFDKITIGRIIGYLRKEQNLSYAELSEGICTKSWICKIEKNDCFPKILQVNVLLQRLGVMDQVFDYLGSYDEEMFYNYRNKLVRDINWLSKEDIIDILFQMKQLKPSKDKLGKQFICFIEAAFLTPENDKYDRLIDAIKLTQPSFENNKMSKRLGWTEFNLVQYIIRSKYKRNPEEGIFLTAEMITKMLSFNYSIEQYQFSLPILYNSLSQYLYNMHKYNALDSLSAKYEEPFLKYYMDALVLFMFIHLKSKLKRRWCLFDRAAEISYTEKCLKLILKNRFCLDLVSIYCDYE